MFGGVERESGKTFLVPVPDRTADTLMAVIDAWGRLRHRCTIFPSSSNPALRSSEIAGEGTGISTRKVTHTALLTTQLASLTCVQAATQTL